ncbi:MAG: KH domain-containing protein [Caldilineaceae bacterium]|nr:KH domain-containing protein [Caldilineaceae bacterium]
MEKLVEFMAKALVEHPDQVRVTKRAQRDRVMLRLEVSQEDAGRVIGKGGRVANAMRTVLRAATTHDGRQVSLKIL